MRTDDHRLVFAFHSIAVLLGSDATSQNDMLDCKKYPLACLADIPEGKLSLSLDLTYFILLLFFVRVHSSSLFPNGTFGAAFLGWR